MSNPRVYAKAQSAGRATDDSWVNLRASRDGAPIVLPWFVALAIEGKAYKVRLGTITAPLEGDIAITDAAAEAAVDAATGYTIIPVYLNVQIESLNGGTLPECAFKSVGAVSTSGTAFVPLNLKIGGPAATNVARVAAAGGVAVAAELATTTRRHFANVAVIAGNSSVLANTYFKLPPMLVGPSSAYLQVAGATAGPLYFAHFDYVELTAAESS